MRIVGVAGSAAWIALIAGCLLAAVGEAQTGKKAGKGKHAAKAAETEPTVLKFDTRGNEMRLAGARGKMSTNFSMTIHAGVNSERVVCDGTIEVLEGAVDVEQSKAVGWNHASSETCTIGPNGAAFHSTGMRGTLKGRVKDNRRVTLVLNEASDPKVVVRFNTRPTGPVARAFRITEKGLEPWTPAEKK